MSRDLLSFRVVESFGGHLESLSVTRSDLEWRAVTRNDTSRGSTRECAESPRVFETVLQYVCIVERFAALAVHVALGPCRSDNVKGQMI